MVSSTPGIHDLCVVLLADSLPMLRFPWLLDVLQVAEQTGGITSFIMKSQNTGPGDRTRCGETPAKAASGTPEAIAKAMYKLAFGFGQCGRSH
ncbi:hypothetical protein NDU88_001200 [Pleurodeles waltl]|uniref:Uncharacterized protein n=1 Tax=Pleurodeles waltl TaxID=8319 RepID=A0AAV7P374_PLEWA|nr:hypothetical protein NDU88_001200 [Pleurodeles waltl]